MDTIPKITLETGLNLRELTTTGSILHINEDYEDSNFIGTPRTESEVIDFIGEPVSSFLDLESTLQPVDDTDFVKKKILDYGGGLPLHDGCTVSISFSGYWENMPNPFDVASLHKPLVVNLKDNGLLPGLEIAVRSMLVGETSLFLLSYKVMYGDMGIPPRIKAKADCVFYIKVIKCILTPDEGEINFAEPNTFQRVHREVKLLYSSGYTLHKAMNYNLATQLFNKAVSMLHRCRLADEKEEQIQEKLLKKLYLNLAISYNKMKRPLRACIACNELNRLNNLWNNGKALLQNARSCRMIGEYGAAEKRLRRAMKLHPDSKEIKEELLLLEKTRNACNQSKLVIHNTSGTIKIGISEEFKNEVDNLIVNFKENADICKLTLPMNLTSEELDYIKEKCIKDNLFINTIPNSVVIEEDSVFLETKKNLVLEKEDTIDDFEY